MTMMKCAVVGATGYTGMELVKILLRHPHARITALTTRQQEAIPIHQLIPSLPKNLKLKVTPYSFENVRKSADVIFLCLPHTEAMETAAKFLAAGKIVIDLSADFRLKDWKTYEKWYGVEHKNRNLIKKAVYGLPELYRAKIKKADLIANPGCYPTASILGVAPLLKHKLIDTQSIVIDAKSGVSGAGKKLVPATQFCEVNENFYAYKVGKHQHTPEITQVLSETANQQISLTFVPHLLPIERGILATIYMKRKKGVNADQIAKAFEKAYEKEPFVRVKREGTYPALHDVQRTNFCDIGFWADPQSERLIVVTAIDNLIKGASGQAIQNFNLRAGFAEDEGLQTW